MLSDGERFAGRFRVLREIGEGGMGLVYAVHDEKLDAQAALKVLHPRLLKKDPGARARFIREARATGKVRSDHVARVIDYDENPEGVPWMLMELLEGDTLEERVARDGPLPLAEARRLVLQLGHALGAAHAAGVVHMDLKPANVFLARSARIGEREVVKVLDFGLARVIDPDRTSAQVTRAMGTYAWSAPEQYSDARVHKTVDVWPLGLIAFWMLTGRQYWRVQSVTDVSNRDFALLSEVTKDDLVPASQRAQELGVGARLPQGFDAWFARCVERDPARRWPDGEAATRALEALLDAAQRESLPTPPLGATLVAMPSVPHELTEPAVPARTVAMPELALPARTVAIPELAVQRPSIEGTAAVPGLSRPERTDPAARDATVASTDPSRTTAPAVERPRDATAAPPKRGALVAVGAVALVALIGAALKLRGPDGPTADARTPSRPAPVTAPDPAPAPAPDPAPAPEAPRCPEGMLFAEGATFTMGRDDGGERERPAHAVNLHAFCIDRTEVTLAAYQSCVAQGGEQACAPANEAWWEGARPAEQRRHAALCADALDPQRPVACVSWDMARAFCRQRGGDLPTEAQWEYVARGADGRAFPWGSEAPDGTRMNGCGPECFAFWQPGRAPGAGDVLYAISDGAVTMIAVDRVTGDRSPLGALGMAGNVSEWTRDCDGAYPADAQTNPTGAACAGPQSPRVARGGSWNTIEADAARTTARLALSPATQTADLGFRCALPPLR